MKIICAWCGKEIEDIPEDEKTSKYEVSHGICLPCKERFLADDEYSLTHFLNKLEAPVLVVNGAGEVALANDQALELLGKGVEQVKGYRGSDVTECAHTTLPGGCGNTRHCVACTIRNNVMQTLETAECKRRVPAYLNQQLNDDKRIVDYLISTEKMGDVVLLRIDHVAIAVRKNYSWLLVVCRLPRIILNRTDLRNPLLTRKLVQASF
jgi:transcriptional regulator of aromatic amino acid metabolism